MKIKCDIDTLNIVLQYSNDLGYNWETLEEYPSNKDSISVNTQQLVDSPQGQFRVQLIDKEGNILGTDYSGYYKVDNEDNCVPWLRYYVSVIENKDIQKSTDVSYMNFMLNINDAENDSLELSIHYKNADSSSYQFIRSELLPASLSDQSVTVYFDTIAMGDEAQLKFILSLSGVI